MLSPEQVDKLTKENIRIIRDLYETALREPGASKEPVHGNVMIATAIIKSAQMIAFAMAKDSVTLRSDKKPASPDAEPNKVVFKPYPHRASGL